MAPLLAASVAACLALGVGALARLQPQPQHTVAQPSPGVTTSAPTSADLNPIGPQPASGADVGDVSCGADGTIRIATPVVEAQRDGVHLRWTTTAKTVASVETGSRRRGGPARSHNRRGAGHGDAELRRSPETR